MYTNDPVAMEEGRCVSVRGGGGAALARFFRDNRDLANLPTAMKGAAMQRAAALAALEMFMIHVQPSGKASLRSAGQAASRFHAPGSP